MMLVLLPNLMVEYVFQLNIKIIKPHYYGAVLRIIHGVLHYIELEIVEHGAHIVQVM